MSLCIVLALVASLSPCVPSQMYDPNSDDANSSYNNNYGNYGNGNNRNNRVPDFNDAADIVNSWSTWTNVMSTNFVRDRVLPYIRQYREQLRPFKKIRWMGQSRGMANGNGNNARFTFVDLDPQEQRQYRKTRTVDTMADLGGLIVREMWRKVKHHCLRCNGTTCELFDAQCGYPFQLFDERADQIYCEVTLAKDVSLLRQGQRPQLQAKMRCDTYPSTPTQPNTMLATRYRKDWRLMCVNCALPNNAARNGGNNSNNNYWNGRNNANNSNRRRNGNNNNNWNGNWNNNGGWNNTRNNNADWNEDAPNNDEWDSNNGNMWNGNGAGNQRTGNGNQRTLRVWTNNQQFSNIYQISAGEGRQMADYINDVRQQIAAGSAPSLPPAAGMNQIYWKQTLASEALKQLQSRDNVRVPLLDLDVVHLLPGYDESQQRRTGAQLLQSAATTAPNATGVYSNHGDNFVELNARNLLLMTVRNYLEQLSNQRNMSCADGVCKATPQHNCGRRNRNSNDWNGGGGGPTGRQQQQQRNWNNRPDNPADYYCYPYEMLYDRAESIGCAVRYSLQGKSQLMAKLVCVIEHKRGHWKKPHRHRVYKMGQACEHCERGNDTCNESTGLLCVNSAAPWQRNGQNGNGGNGWRGN